MTGQLLKTPLHDWHAAHQGRLVDFAGWSMPVQYRSIKEEHLATRGAIGLFDVSHMGRLRFSGSDVARRLDALLTRRVTDLAPGRIRYSLVTNDAGGILDDVLIYRLPAPRDAEFQLVVNASNREKIVAHLAPRLADSGVTLRDETLATVMIAVQGPRALQVLKPLIPSVDLPAMPYYSAVESTVAGQPGLVSRTGYTGEDGCELIVPAQAGLEIWETILGQGAQAVGLGARDTLRLESAMPLYGHELSEQINPLEAGLGFAVNLDGRDFLGRDALAAIQAAGPRRTRIGLALTGGRVPRENYPILRGDEPVGVVTSGTFSPTLDRPIAMGYVLPAAAALGGQLSIDIRGKAEPASVVSLPFYKRTA